MFQKYSLIFWGGYVILAKLYRRLLRPSQKLGFDPNTIKVLTSFLEMSIEFLLEI
jgi:hypothetical protein